MSLEGLVAVVVMVVVGIIGIALPFFTAKTKNGNVQIIKLQQSRDELITSYERVLATLRDLDEDFRSGKIHQEEYERERAYWSSYGVRLLELLENAEVPAMESYPALDTHTAAHDELDQAVEEAIRNYRMALQETDKSS